MIQQINTWFLQTSVTSTYMMSEYFGPSGVLILRLKTSVTSTYRMDEYLGPWGFLILRLRMELKVMLLKIIQLFLRHKVTAHPTFGRKSADRTEHGNYVIFFPFLATVFGNLEVWKVKK